MIFKKNKSLDNKPERYQITAPIDKTELDAYEAQMFLLRLLNSGVQRIDDSGDALDELDDLISW